ncbi:redoxin domain-containing protein [Planomicrobium sp. CPCC 101079]|nr:redoxin domain-containing protein [Planomicrobium sp. CPCC 101079]
MVQLHENIEVLKGLDVNTYIVSGDTPEQQLQLYTALKEKYGESLPFVSDPDLKIIDLLNMKNGDVAYRGYGMLDTDGTVVFNEANDLWGEELPQTMEKINEEYNKLSGK